MKKQLQKGAILPIIFILGALVILGGSVVFFSKQNQKTEIPSKTIMEKEAEKKAIIYEYQGELKDVVGGNSLGLVRANFADEAYDMIAIFENLPEPTGDDFYEGWIVRQGADSSVISTGRVMMFDGEYINIYESNQDLTDHTFYVLTIEPDDGDPAPADHVLEGILKKNIGS
jgi:hypothetical protein